MTMVKMSYLIVLKTVMEKNPDFVPVSGSTPKVLLWARIHPPGFVEICSVPFV